MSGNGTIVKTKLAGMIVSDFLACKAKNGGVFYSDSNHVLGTCDCYFSTPSLVKFINKKFSNKNGLCYSFNYSDEAISFLLVANDKYLDNDSLMDYLFAKFKIDPIHNEKVILFKVNVADYKNDIDDKRINAALSNYIEKQLADFEKELINIDSEFTEEVLNEGKPITVNLTKYERNRVARLKCIEHYGYRCQICGFDFKEVYGKDFEGMIEVHHRIPLSKIKADYVVDPIKDLIPVCPNCHSAIHSKNGEEDFYTVEEIKKIIMEDKKQLS